MRLYYVISDQYPYDQFIAGDVGPKFAADYGWNTISISSVSELEADIYIIDPWIDENEIIALEKIIRRFDNSIFLVHAVDPWPFIRGQPIYSLAMKLAGLRNFGVASVYHPTENWASIWSNCSTWSPILTPYLYDKNLELKISHSERSSRTIITGNIGVNDYPLRANANKHRTINPIFWRKIDRLQHPGYFIDKPKLDHGIVQDKFVAFLSKYKFAFVCSSRNRLEFLKYREIAYAGCVPVGDMPGTLSDCPDEAYIHWRRNFFQTWRRLSKKQDTEKIAQHYRKFIASARDKKYWRDRVIGQFDMMITSYRQQSKRSN